LNPAAFWIETPPRARLLHLLSLTLRLPKSPSLPTRPWPLAAGLLALAWALPCPAAAEDDATFSALNQEAEQAFKKDVAPFVKRYCMECHGNRRTKGGLNFEPALKKPGEASASHKWTQAFANVNAHDMPPDDSDQPSDEERQQFLDGLGKVKYLSDRDPGPFVIRRLTKTEYANTLRDLLGVDPTIASDLPDEVAGEGYLNSLSPMQTEQYLSLANEALDRAFAPPGQPPTAIQKQLLGEPLPADADPRPAVEKIAQKLARQAFRRPPSTEEVQVLLGVFDLGRANQLDPPAALRLMLKAVLVSPQFLFITPAKPVDSKDRIVPLDDHQLASRLSYLLWATMPDAELAKKADQGTLHQPAVLKAQVKRLLADPRSRALFDGFGAHWLGLGKLATKPFDAAKFPQMTPAMRTAMYDEARLFFDSIVRENRSVVSFVESDYTFLNSTLATLYGLEKTITSPEMQRVQLSDANRGGILGMPGILATTSFPNRTSAVNRGVWVLEQVLGQHVPPAPPNVPALEKQDQKKVGNLTLRQRTELHRTNAVCANCHKILDPIGFGLENFDAIGRWRDQDDTGGPIDAAGELPSGQTFSSPKELKALIAARQDDLARNLTEKLLAYALCRQLKGYDEIVVDQLMQTIAQDGYKMQTLITEIVTSYLFLNRRVGE
jgi:mono/diheme cytochrome c family protein